MNEITILGIDLAKNTFQLIGVDKHHKVVMKRRCQRDKLVEIVTNLPRCTIMMESCGTTTGVHKKWFLYFLFFKLIVNVCVYCERGC